MRKLILVRHSAPEIVSSVPAREWRLSTEGRRRCMKLAERLAAHAPSCFVASSEPKASETAELVAGVLGMTWSSAPGLHEHERSKVGYLGDAEFEATIARFFAQPDRLVWGDETADQAHGRFAHAVDEALQRCASGNVAIFTHGTVMSLFVGRATGVDPFTFWQSLGLPAFVVLAHPGWELLETVTWVE